MKERYVDGEGGRTSRGSWPTWTAVLCHLNWSEGEWEGGRMGGGRDIYTCNHKPC